LPDYEKKSGEVKRPSFTSPQFLSREELTEENDETIPTRFTASRRSGPCVGETTLFPRAG